MSVRALTVLGALMLVGAPLRQWVLDRTREQIAMLGVFIRAGERDGSAASLAAGEAAGALEEEIAAAEMILERESSGSDLSLAARCDDRPLDARCRVFGASTPSAWPRRRRRSAEGDPGPIARGFAGLGSLGSAMANVLGDRGVSGMLDASGSWPGEQTAGERSALETVHSHAVFMFIDGDGAASGCAQVGVRCRPIAHVAEVSDTDWDRLVAAQADGGRQWGLWVEHVRVVQMTAFIDSGSLPHPTLNQWGFGGGSKRDGSRALGGFRAYGQEEQIGGLPVSCVSVKASELLARAVLKEWLAEFAALAPTYTDVEVGDGRPLHAVARAGFCGCVDAPGLGLTDRHVEASRAGSTVFAWRASCGAVDGLPTVPAETFA